MKRNRQKRIFLITAIGLLLFTIPAIGAEFPTKPITLVNPWLPGGDLSTVYRAAGEVVGKVLKQPVIVDDKPGASGTLGISTMMAIAKPDGYTICHYHGTIIRFAEIGLLNFDPINDFTFIIQLSMYTYGIAVKEDAPWKNLQELIKYAKANPKKLKYGAAGKWVPAHCYMELLAKDHDIDLINVPMKGGMELITSLLGGHVDFIVNPVQWRTQMEAGQIRTLATFTEKRTKWWPDVPTAKESGFNYVLSYPIGLAGPKGIDPKVVKILHDAFKRSSEEPAFRKLQDHYAHQHAYLNSKDFENSMKKLRKDEKMLVEKFNLKEILGKGKK